jgi:hypothetical protein
VLAAIYTTILQNKLGQNIPSELSSAAEETGLPTSSIPQLITAFTSGNTTLIESVPGITPDVIAAASTAMKDAYSASFRVVYLASIAFGAFAIFWSFFTTDVDHLMTNDVARKLHDAGQHGDAKIEEKKDLENV